MMTLVFFGVDAPGKAGNGEYKYVLLLYSIKTPKSFLFLAVCSVYRIGWFGMRSNRVQFKSSLAVSCINSSAISMPKTAMIIPSLQGDHDAEARSASSTRIEVLLTQTITNRNNLACSRDFLFILHASNVDSLAPSPTGVSVM